MRLEYLISEINEAVYKKIMENRSMEEEEAREVAKKVGLAAIKYGDLSNQASKDYIFDIDRFTSFEGETGPYLLYTIVRIKSILAKYQELHKENAGKRILPAYSQSETDLSLVLIRFGEMILAAYRENAPHKVCQYLYELSNAFNKFYHENKIIGEEDEKKQSSWISLITLTGNILNCGISLLGIEAPDRM
jgi:arginyl-tRNA synthetase